jgi:hypothetical protein
MKRGDFILLICGILAAGAVLVGGILLIMQSNEAFDKKAQTTCKQIAGYSNSNEYKTDGYGNCYFVKDGKLEKVENQ